MKALLKIFWIGLTVSFLGTLPPAMLNLAAIQISVSDGIVAGLLFSLGALLVEMGFVRAALVAIEWFRRRSKWFKVIEWFSVVIILVLAFGSFRAALSTEDGGRNEILSPNLHPFLIGVVLRALSPMLIPFWFGWSTVLVDRGVLKPQNSHYNAYVVGIGLGTLLGHTIYIVGGSMAADFFESWQSVFYWVVGGILLFTAGLQIWQIVQKKGVAERLQSPKPAKKQ